MEELITELIFLFQNTNTLVVGNLKINFPFLQL